MMAGSPSGTAATASETPSRTTVTTSSGAVDAEDEENGRDHHDGDHQHADPQQLAGAGDLALQRCRLVVDGAHQAGDLPRLRGHRRGRHHRPPDALGDRRALEHHVGFGRRATVGSVRVRGVFEHGFTQARQRRLRHLQPRGDSSRASAATASPSVSSSTSPGTSSLAGTVRRAPSRMTVAEVGGHPRQRADRALRALFLRVTQERVQDEDDRDHHRVDGPAAVPPRQPRPRARRSARRAASRSVGCETAPRSFLHVGAGGTLSISFAPTTTSRRAASCGAQSEFRVGAQLFDDCCACRGARGRGRSVRSSPTDSSPAGPATGSSSGGYLTTWERRTPWRESRRMWRLATVCRQPSAVARRYGTAPMRCPAGLHHAVANDVFDEDGHEGLDRRIDELLSGLLAPALDLGGPLLVAEPFVSGQLVGDVGHRSRHR